MARRRNVGVVDELMKIECMDAEDLKGWTPEQAAALHHFKHKVAAGMYKLYMHVPEDMVNKVIGAKAQKLISLLNDI